MSSIQELPSAKMEKPAVYRYNAVIPAPIMDEVVAVSRKQGTTVLAMIIKFIRIGLALLKYEREGYQIIIRDGENEKQLVIF